MPGSNRSVWWQCSRDPSHEWEAAIVSRVNGHKQCRWCNSLRALYPDIAAEWHPNKNGKLTPDNCKARSEQKVWWQCSRDRAHEWKTSISSRVRGSGCHICAGKIATATTSLLTRYPELAAEWHENKNKSLTPDKVLPGSGRKVWWQCMTDPSHEWQATIEKRVLGQKTCPMCNSLATHNPDLAAEWHRTKNGDLLPTRVPPGSGKKVWWRCAKDPSHEWQATISNRAKKGSGCPICSGRKAGPSTSLELLHPQVASERHLTFNGELTPDRVRPGSGQKAWWQCSRDSTHVWQAVISSRTSGTGCPMCSGREPTPTTSLSATYSDIAAEWHPTKNLPLTPEDVVSGSEKKVWWRCSRDASHEWEARISPRTMKGVGCPLCNQGWTVQKIRHFVASLRQHLSVFFAAELYLLFQQSGLLDSAGIGKTFVKALVTGRFPVEELDEFIAGKPSLVDKFVDNADSTLEAPAKLRPRLYAKLEELTNDRDRLKAELAALASHATQSTGKGDAEVDQAIDALRGLREAFSEARPEDTKELLSSVVSRIELHYDHTAGETGRSASTFTHGTIYVRPAVKGSTLLSNKGSLSELRASCWPQCNAVQGSVRSDKQSK